MEITFENYKDKIKKEFDKDSGNIILSINEPEFACMVSGATEKQAISKLKRIFKPMSYVVDLLCLSKVRQS